MILPNEPHVQVQIVTGTPQLPVEEFTKLEDQGCRYVASETDLQFFILVTVPDEPRFEHGVFITGNIDGIQFIASQFANRKICQWPSSSGACLASDRAGPAVRELRFSKLNFGDARNATSQSAADIGTIKMEIHTCKPMSQKQKLIHHNRDVGHHPQPAVPEAADDPLHRERDFKKDFKAHCVKFEKTSSNLNMSSFLRGKLVGTYVFKYRPISALEALGVVGSDGTPLGGEIPASPTVLPAPPSLKREFIDLEDDSRPIKRERYDRVSLDDVPEYRFIKEGGRKVIVLED